MEARLHIPEVLSYAGFDAALRGLQGIAEEEIRQGFVPPLYDSGVRYQREPLGQEHWLSPSGVLGRGLGDCEDLAAWRAGELVVTGEDPNARAVVVQTGPRTWHAVVEREDGSFEDPSAALGMGRAAGIAAPVAFTLEPGRGRDYRARVEVVGLGAHSAHDYIEGCPACALLGALDDAAQGQLGQLPFIGPILDIFSQAANLARPPALNVNMPARLPSAQAPAPLRLPAPTNVEPIEPESIDEGLMRLARSLKRLARTEVNRRVNRAKQRI